MWYVLQVNQNSANGSAHASIIARGDNETEAKLNAVRRVNRETKDMYGEEVDVLYTENLEGYRALQRTQIEMGDTTLCLLQTPADLSLSAELV